MRGPWPTGGTAVDAEEVWRLNRLRLLDHAPGAAVECGDLSLREPALPGKRGEVGNAARSGGGESLGGAFGLGRERLNLTEAGGELEGQPSELRPAVPRIGRRLGSLEGAPLELVEPGDGVVERCGPEEDGDGVGLSLLVEGAEPVAQEPLGGLEISLYHGHLPAHLLLFGSEGVCASPEGRELAPGPGQAGIEGIEAEQGGVRAAGQGLLALSELLRGRAAFGPR